MSKAPQQAPTSTVTQTKSIPGWAQPYAKKLLSEGYSLYQKPYEAYTGKTVAPFAQETELGLQSMMNRALAGSPVTSAASANAAKTLQGDYLNPESNPYLKATYQSAADDITRNYLNSVVPQLSAAATRAGAFGGSSDALLRGEAMNNLGKTLSDTATDIYGQNYANERTNQLRALALAPQTAETEYADINKILGVGDVRRQYEQDLLNEQYRKFAEEQGYPYSQLQMLGNTLGMAVGNQGTSTQTTSAYQPSMASQLFGGLTSGAGLGAMAYEMTGNPFTAALGLIPVLGSLF